MQDHGAPRVLIKSRGPRARPQKRIENVRVQNSAAVAVADAHASLLLSSVRARARVTGGMEMAILLLVL